MMNRFDRLARPARALAAAAVAVVAAGVVTAPAWSDQAIGEGRLENGAPYSFADLIERVSPAVVSISVSTENPSVTFDGEEFDFEGMPEDFREFFREFRRRFDGPRREGSSLGSGFFISADGHVVTNNHVIENAASITVKLKTGEEYEAEVLGRDRASDLAVLKVEADERFAFVSFADEMDLRVGDWVVAVGNPFGLESTATAGIVSALNREINAQYNDFIQIDAPINRGNSGGPTFDLRGRVVGVNSQIFSPSGGSVGIGFAIPADIAARYAEELIENGRIARGWLGVQIDSVSEDFAMALDMENARGAIVVSVIEGSPAERAGFEQQDVVLAVNGEQIEDALDLTRRVGDLIAGETVRFDVLRDGRTRRINVRIGERPTDGDLAEAAGAGSEESDGFEGSVFGMSLRGLTDDDRERLDLADDETGAVIDNVEFGGVASDRGLREGEAILEVGGRDVDSPGGFRTMISDARDGGPEMVLLLVVGENGPRFIAMPIAEEG